LLNPKGAVAMVDEQKRFEEVVLYIAERTKDDANFGQTKLAKVLFYSDFDAYRELGRAITGAEYHAWEHGPYPPKLRSAKNLLRSSGRATIDDAVDEFDTERVVATGREPSNLTALGVNEAERAIIDRWISYVGNATAGKIKRLAHDHPGYRMVPRDAPIPYAATFLAISPPTDEDAEDAVLVARAQGWLVGDEWQWA
jgi:uncharacterized phage-associated protein